LIDLHTHTTASDGRCGPTELVDRAAAAGVTVLSVTDHDTVGGCEAAAARCRDTGIEFVSGIEITSVADGADVHILGDFVDAASPVLATFLAEQRRQRVERVGAILERLAAQGIVLDAAAILRPAADNPSTSIGRPWVARALIAAGHVATSDQAFERWLARGRPGFVPRHGPSPAEVLQRIHECGGLASLAHPVLVRRDEWLPELARDGLDALEAYHSDHDAAATWHYLEIAQRLGLAVTGGSDFHGDESHGPGGPGCVSLPREAYERLKSRIRST
jgi:predicted metal-dependent phosphoesterase TrpH